MEEVVVRTESVKSASDSKFQPAGHTNPYAAKGDEHSTQVPLRSDSINFFELVEGLDKDICPPLSPVDDNAPNIFKHASPAAQDSCSALSTNMDFETLTGTAESVMQLAGPAPPLSWTSEQSTASATPVHRSAASTPFGTAESAETPFDSLLASAMPDDEVMSMTFVPAVKPQLEQVQALEEFLRRDSLDDSPSLAGFDSRDSVYSAPGLETHHSFGEVDTKLSSAPAPFEALNRSVSMALLGRSMSAAAAPAIQRAYSTAGPGTNRPPKDGSQSALLPKDKLNRKRAAARRYYHNQKNKAVDFEVTISRLETENQALGKELLNALKQLEQLKNAQVAPMSVC